MRSVFLLKKIKMRPSYEMLKPKYYFLYRVRFVIEELYYRIEICNVTTINHITPNHTRK